MRSKVAERILAKTPEETKIFVKWYTDIAVRINQVLREKGMSQKELAELMDKKPSEISKWLKGEHNFTLKSLAKLQAELGEELITVVSAEAVTNTSENDVHMEESFENTPLVAMVYTQENNKYEHYPIAS